MADNMITILCLRKGRWETESIAGETTTLIQDANSLPAVFAALDDRLNLRGKLKDVQVVIVYAQAAADRLAEAVTQLNARGCMPSEILRLERAGCWNGSAADTMDLLFPGSAPLAAPRPATPAASPAASPAPPRSAPASSAVRFFTIDAGSSHAALVYDSHSGLIWASQPGAPEPLSSAQGTSIASRLQLAGLPHWRVPERHELSSFAAVPQPLRGKNGKTLLERWNWLCTEGRLDIVKNRLAPEPDAGGYLLPVLDMARGQSLAQFSEAVRRHGWQMAPWSA